MLEKILGAVCVVAALGCAWFAMDPYGVERFRFGGKMSFSDSVSEELHMMQKKNLLPKEWDSIQYVAYNFNADYQRELVGNRKFKIKDGPAGRYALEIEFIDSPDDQNPALVLQMSLTDLASKNKIWELGKTYGLAAYMKKEEPAQTATPAGASTNTPPAPTAQPAK